MIYLRSSGDLEDENLRTRTVPLSYETYSVIKGCFKSGFYFYEHYMTTVSRLCNDSQWANFNVVIAAAVFVYCYDDD
ncbi:hypothetical protein T06_2085 [Trichinella sp. T6]|nr:hypothetical protein T06_2085 [Trichinella sp. T6]